jgi:hypothetical protein
LVPVLAALARVLAALARVVVAPVALVPAPVAWVTVLVALVPVALVAWVPALVTVLVALVPPPVALASVVSVPVGWRQSAPYRADHPRFRPRRRSTPSFRRLARPRAGTADARCPTCCSLLVVRVGHAFWVLLRP